MTKIRFEDLPSVNTPINAENLNKLNNVIVSREEPATGEEVWLQKGENLFDYKNAEYFPAFINTSTGIWDVAYEDSYGYKSTIIKVKPNTTYTISKRIGKTFRIATFTNYPEYYGTYNETWANHTGTEISITTGANDNYLVILCFANYNGDTGTYLDMYSTVQIERGEVATPYEPYIPKKIYVKTNDVYEEFYNEENREVYSTDEQKIGIWLGKPLYRKVFEVPETSLSASNTTVINFNLDGNVDVKKMNGFIKTQTSNYGFNLAYNGMYDGFRIRLFNNTIQVLAGTDVAPEKKIISGNVIVEYTKTTD